MSEGIRARLDRARRTIHDYPATTTLVAVIMSIAIVGIVVPDAVAIWIFVALIGGLLGGMILCLSQLEKVSRRSSRRPR